MFKQHCNICGSNEFIDFNGRTKIRCVSCHSMERSRLMFALLERQGRLKRGIKVLHFAPDHGLAHRLQALASDYIGADLNPDQYKKILRSTAKVDLCNDSDYRPFLGKFDLVLHNHVLEHLPATVGAIMSNMVSCLRHGGEMFFSTPIRRNAVTDEDFETELTTEQRRKRFGQEDHVRIFGDKDVVRVLNSGRAVVNAISALDWLSEEELKMIRVPLSEGLGGETIFSAH